MIFELWFSAGDGYSFFQDSNVSAKNLLTSDAKLIAVIHASDWEEAQAKKHELLGWQAYQPMVKQDPSG